MRRLHLFEFHDLEGTPQLIKESVTEILGTFWRWTGIVKPLGPVFADFVERSGCRKVLDLGSGSGEPVLLLVEGLEQHGAKSVRFTLSDLYPKVDAMERVAGRYPDLIEVMREPVDATHVPETLECDACTVVGVFHHFPPDVARRILADCAARGRGVFILDLARGIPRKLLLRHLLLFPLFSSISIGAALANPFLSRRNRLLKALFTYLLPILPLISGWDGIVSYLRMYKESELCEMAWGLNEEYEWKYEEFDLRFGARAMAFSGAPRRGRTAGNAKGVET